MALGFLFLIFVLLVALTELYFFVRRFLFKKTYRKLINPEEKMPLEKFLKNIFCLANINRQVLKPIYLFSAIIGFFLFGSVLSDFFNLLFSGSFEKIIEVTKELLFSFSLDKLFKLKHLRYDSMFRLILSVVFTFPLVYLLFKMFSQRNKDHDIGLRGITDGRELTKDDFNKITEWTDNLIDKHHSEKIKIIKLLKLAFKILILPFTAVIFKEMTYEIALNSILLIISALISFSIAIYQDFDTFDAIKYIGTKNYFKYGYAKQLVLKMRTFIEPEKK